MLRSRLLLCFALFVPVACGAFERPITSCEKAPALAGFRKQLPGYILGTEATVPPTTKEKFSFDQGTLLREGGPRVCIVVAVSKAGVVQDAAIAYPKGMALPKRQRDQLMAMHWNPAMVDGEPRDALMIVSVTVY